LKVIHAFVDLNEKNASIVKLILLKSIACVAIISLLAIQEFLASSPAKIGARTKTFCVGIFLPRLLNYSWKLL